MSLTGFWHFYGTLLNEKDYENASVKINLFWGRRVSVVITFKTNSKTYEWKSVIKIFLS